MTQQMDVTFDFFEVFVAAKCLLSQPISRYYNSESPSFPLLFLVWHNTPGVAKALSEDIAHNRVYNISSQILYVSGSGRFIWISESSMS